MAIFSRVLSRVAVAATSVLLCAGAAFAQDKPNILFIVSDDTGYGDLGPYGGGEGRGHADAQRSTTWPRRA